MTNMIRESGELRSVVSHVRRELRSFLNMTSLLILIT